METLDSDFSEDALTHFDSFSSSKSGAVLLYVIALTAVLASTLTLAMLERQANLKWVQARVQAGEARYMTYSSLEFVRSLLEKDLTRNIHDGAGDLWWRFTEPQSYPIDNGRIALTIQDAHRFANVNALSTGTVREGPFRTVMQRWLSATGVSGGLLDSLRDWVDADVNVSGAYGAESGYYTGRQPGYRAADQPIEIFADFRLLSAYRPEEDARLQASLSYVPRHVDLNVNTADQAYIKTIFQGQNHTLDNALGQRNRQQYQTLGEFYKDASIDTPPKSLGLTTQTTYFDMQTEVTYYNSKRRLRARFERLDGRVRLVNISWL